MRNRLFICLEVGPGWSSRTSSRTEHECNCRCAGQVYRVREKYSKQVMVLKCMEKSAILDEGVKHQICNEIEIHCRLKHPGIINMYGYFQDEERCKFQWAHSS